MPSGDNIMKVTFAALNISSTFLQTPEAAECGCFHKHLHVLLSLIIFKAEGGTNPERLCEDTQQRQGVWSSSSSVQAGEEREAVSIRMKVLDWRPRPLACRAAPRYL